MSNIKIQRTASTLSELSLLPCPPLILALGSSKSLYAEAAMSVNNAPWRDLVPACFGVADLRFARHPLDEARAKNMIRAARESGSTITDISKAIEAYLASKDASSSHIDNELAYASKLIQKYFK